jgi:exonuclease III
MTLNLIFHNIQGLNNPLASLLVRNYYSGKLNTLDILCLQEHKLRGC